MRGIKIIISVLLISLLLLTSVSAAFDADSAYAFLVSQKADDGSYNSDVIDTSIAVLALGNINYDAFAEKEFLLSKKDNVQGCWPAGGCKIKDTAFAMMAMNVLGENIQDSVDYLTKSQSVANINGKWLLQVASKESGTCKVSYADNNGDFQEKTITLEDGVFTQCGSGKSTFLDVNACIQSGLLQSRAPILLDVNCNTLSNVAVISTIFNAGNTYYLVDEQPASRAEVSVQNGCYGKTKGGSCDLESTIWANIALVEIGQSPTNEFYIRQNADSANAFHQAALAIITSDLIYSQNLADSQRNDGSWGGNVFNTALAVKALSGSEFGDAAVNAEPFFELRQNDDGSVGSVFDTSLVLWAGLTSVSVSGTCFEGQERLCPSQAGVCVGAKEVCVDGVFTGCDEASLLEHNSSYEFVEFSCDGLDNDCDGDADTSCECSPEDTVECGYQLGVCEGAVQLCVDGFFAGCEYTNITGFDGITEVTCGDGLDNDCDGLVDSDDDDCEVTSSICNYDDICDFDRGEDENNCADDCSFACSNGEKDPFENGVDCEGPCLASCDLGDCVKNGLCETTFGETTNNCPEDCFCGDNKCDNSEDAFSCPQDCEGFVPECGDGICSEPDEDEFNCELDCASVGPRPSATPEDTGGSGLIWIIIIILILILAGVGYWYYSKQGKDKKKPNDPFARRPLPGQKPEEKKEPKPIFQSIFGKKNDDSKKPVAAQRPTPQQKPASKVESELEKSLREAKALLKKKEK